MGRSSTAWSEAVSPAEAFTYVNADSRRPVQGGAMSAPPKPVPGGRAACDFEPLAHTPVHLGVTNATIRLWEAFAPLDPPRRRWALTVGVVEIVRAGEDYSGSGEVAVVVSGCLALDASASGLTAAILGPGQVAATGSHRKVSGRWITDGELFRVGVDVWSETAGLAGVNHILAAAGGRQANLEAQIHCFALHRATARVADLVLAVHHAASDPRILLSQERIGVMLGLRRTTVNSSCRALEKVGASRTRRGEMRIIDLGALEQAACGCRGTANANHHYRKPGDFSRPQPPNDGS